MAAAAGLLLTRVALAAQLLAMATCQDVIAGLRARLAVMAITALSTGASKPDGWPAAVLAVALAVALRTVLAVAVAMVGSDPVAVVVARAQRLLAALAVMVVLAS